MSNEMTPDEKYDKEVLKRLKEEAKKDKKDDDSKAHAHTNASKMELLTRLKKQRLVLQSKDNVVFEGDLLEIVEGFFILKDVTITGRHHIARPPWALVDRKNISHIHPVCAVEQFSEEKYDSY
ncbi:MAG: hypothetical protein HQM14_04040 [SAR324 cluster bacterium]|nr:hypothetical protein [SAR324 cluster bacterium]